MTMLAEHVDVVIGIDTHKHTHTAAVVAATTGAVLETITVSADPDGYGELVELADAHAALRAWAIAKLAGVAPIPASTGVTNRHRYNPFGDRQLNRALHLVVVHRMRRHDETRAYVQRRRAEGKTDREIRRCLKRYVARDFYRRHEQPLDKR